MSEELSIEFLLRDKQKSDYDWVNIDIGPERVGKARCLINGKTITIYSINIFPEFQGHNYGKEIIEEFKKSFDTIIADRVRNTAVGFWDKMGFIDAKDGTFVYHREKS